MKKQVAKFMGGSKPMPVNVIGPVGNKNDYRSRQLRGGKCIDRSRSRTSEWHQGDDETVSLHQAHHVRDRCRSESPGPTQALGRLDWPGFS
jgi:hypothetical protein